MVCACCRSPQPPNPSPYFLMLSSPCTHLGTFTFATPEMDDKQHMHVNVLACSSSRQPCYKGCHKTCQWQGQRQVPGRGQDISFPYNVAVGKSIITSPLPPLYVTGTVRAEQTVPGGHLLSGRALEPRPSGSRAVSLTSMTHPCHPHQWHKCLIRKERENIPHTRSLTLPKLHHAILWENGGVDLKTEEWCRCPPGLPAFTHSVWPAGPSGSGSLRCDSNWSHWMCP